MEDNLRKNVYEWKNNRQSDVNKITWRIRKLMLRRLIKRYMLLENQTQMREPKRSRSAPKPGGCYV